MDRETLLVRYATLAANRRHFETLFFAVVAFSWCFGLATWAAITALEPGAAGVPLLAAGAILSGGAFIAYRLMLRERSAFAAMAGSWKEIAGETSAGPKARLRPGAMATAAAGQGIVGLITLIAGAIVLG